MSGPKSAPTAAIRKARVKANTRRQVRRVLPVEFSKLRSRLQKVAQADTVQHLGANAVEHREADIGAIHCGIDVNAKRPLSEWRVDDIHDRLGDGAGVSIGRDDGCKRLLDLLAKAIVRTHLAPPGIGRSTRMREVVGAGGEGAGHDNRSLDAPA